MCQINPKEIVEEGIVMLSKYSEVQQVGIDLSTAEPLTLTPKSCKNILLNERINLPDDIYATFQQRSSYSRKGVFCTTGIYDPGYQGALGCTVYNLSDEVVEIPLNTRIGQLVCHNADPASTYNGSYQGLTKEIESKI